MVEWQVHRLVGRLPEVAYDKVVGGAELGVGDSPIDITHPRNTISSNIGLIYNHDHHLV